MTRVPPNFNNRYPRQTGTVDAGEEVRTMLAYGLVGKDWLQPVDYPLLLR